MSKKIRNLMLRGEEAIVSSFKVLFDNEGIGVIESDELHAELLTMPNFHPVEEEDKKEDSNTNPDPNSEEGKAMEENKEGSQEQVVDEKVGEATPDSTPTIEEGGKEDPKKSTAKK